MSSSSQESNRRAENFRNWFSSVGGQKLELPANSFQSSDRATGVATCLLVLNRFE